MLLVGDNAFTLFHEFEIYGSITGKAERNIKGIGIVGGFFLATINTCI
jgi:hypothetical protein